MEPVVEINGLRKSYGSGAEALAGVDLAVERGDCFGLLGPNGAGKTTLISILCGILAPSSGTVRVYGKLPGKDRRLRKRVALVPQDIALYPTLTARENLFYFGRMLGLSGRHLSDSVEKSVGFLDLAESSDRRVEQCSGGIKRRINLSVALLGQPGLLVLDEPTAGIDVQTRLNILEKIAELNRKGMTLVYTSHYIEEAQKVCNRVAVMDSGRVLTQGPLDEVISLHSDCTNLEEVFLKLTGRGLRE
ncbi:MAG: ABC transporter ATP-binding protein [Deltaproteobacteria bacterium]|nr:ABC transporter ATP-binding protein [Deltaproteobacteria bacterium]MBW2110204.1 ABC transporter ATP-binding protein [Deltaproteobacteria bacterium]